MSILSSITSYILSALRATSPLAQPLILGLVAATILFLLIAPTLGFLFFVLMIAALSVFTDRPRLVPMGAGVVVSPVDGYLMDIRENQGLPLMFDQATNQSETFRHVMVRQSFRAPRILCAPASATVREIVRTTPEVAKKNARYNWPQMDGIAILMVADDGAEYALMIKGWVMPKQISLTIQVGDHLEAGSTIGISLFYATVDLYVPSTAPLLRAPSQGLRAGETVLMVPSFQQSPLYRQT